MIRTLITMAALSFLAAAHAHPSFAQTPTPFGYRAVGYEAYPWSPAVPTWPQYGPLIPADIYPARSFSYRSYHAGYDDGVYDAGGGYGRGGGGGRGYYRFYRGAW